MSIEVQCTQCGAIQQVNDRMAGRRLRCRECDTVVDVPEQLPEEVESESEVLEPEVVEHMDVDIAVAQSGDIIVEEAELEEIITVGSGSVELTEADREQVVAVEGADQGPTPSSIEDDDEDEQVPTRKPREEEELDMTPMVDVTFLLLIFFMVTASFALQKSIEMPRQQTDAPSTTVQEEEEDEKDMVELQIDENGSFLVLAADWEKETPGKVNLISALNDARSGNDNVRLAIKVHELAKLQFLVDGMDAGTIAGFAELEVTQVEEFD